MPLTNMVSGELKHKAKKSPAVASGAPRHGRIFHDDRRLGCARVV